MNNPANWMGLVVAPCYQGRASAYRRVMLPHISHRQRRAALRGQLLLWRLDGLRQPEREVAALLQVGVLRLRQLAWQARARGKAAATPPLLTPDELRGLSNPPPLLRLALRPGSPSIRTQRSTTPKGGPMQPEETTANAETSAQFLDAASTEVARPPLVAPDPSIGRVVWFYPSGRGAGYPNDQPHSAQIAYVHSQSLVNLGCIDGNGNPYAATSVALYHPDAVPDWQKANGGYATWMPFQCK